MKERPIIFSAPMVRAILAGTKTQTRRVLKIPGIMPRTSFQITSPDEEIVRFDDGTFHYLSTAALSGPYPCPYGRPGDRLWVREAWSYHPDFPQSVRRSIYRAECGVENDVERWTPSIHMPRWASRILLEIVSVRVNRLQDISESDALAEGILYDQLPENEQDATRARTWYRGIFDAINGQGSWSANPWVWVIEFRRAA